MFESMLSIGSRLSNCFVICCETGRYLGTLGKVQGWKWFQLRRRGT